MSPGFDAYDTYTITPIDPGVKLADGTQVYHGGRRQWGIVSAPDGIANNPGTHWVVFDGADDVAEVSNELLAVASSGRRTPAEQAPPVIPGQPHAGAGQAGAGDLLPGFFV